MWTSGQSRCGASCCTPEKSWSIPPRHRRSPPAPVVVDTPGARLHRAGHLLCRARRCPQRGAFSGHVTFEGAVRISLANGAQLPQIRRLQQARFTAGWHRILTAAPTWREKAGRAGQLVTDDYLWPLSWPSSALHPGCRHGQPAGRTLLVGAYPIAHARPRHPRHPRRTGERLAGPCVERTPAGGGTSARVERIGARTVVPPLARCGIPDETPISSGARIP